MTPDFPGIEPYPGLRAYEAHENHLFFGRDEQSDELLRRLRLNRFLAVVGTSGSGKSSLVRAGLLPSLYGGFMAKAGSVWRIATMRPGADPIGNLAAALYTPEVFGNDAGAESASTASLFAETTLRRGPLGLVEVTRYGRLAPDENLLILVDQFEEIFRFARASDGEHKDDSAGFVKLLLEAARQHEIPIYVILTMRSDFLGDCARFRGLPETINDGQYLVPRLTRDQLRQAIVGPASVGGAEVAPRLVQRLLGEVGDDPDQLPILQHALMRTWELWAKGGRKGPLDLDDYQKTGGMATALSRHADEAYLELKTKTRQEIARILFQRLSEKSEDHREIRRPTRLDELCAVVEASPEEVTAVIEVFRQPGRSFLMPPANVPLTAHSAIDISHESLMRVWKQLKDWVNEEAESAAQYRRLAQSAALAAKGKAGAMKDPELTINLRWRDEWRPNATWADRYHPGFASANAYLEKSRELDQLAKRADEEKRRRELNRARGFAAILLLACLIVTAGLFFALKQKSEAERQRTDAETARKAAADAELKALKASGEAWEAQGSALTAQARAEKEKNNAEKSAQQARSEREVALARESAAQGLDKHDGQFDLALLLSVKALDLIGSKDVKSNSSSGLKSDIDSSSFVKNHTIQEAKATLLETVQSHPQLTAYLHGHTAPVNCVTYTRDGKLLASGSDDGAIILWDVSSHKEIGRLHGHLGTVNSVSFSPDGTKLASGSMDRTVILWNVASREKIGHLTGHLGAVNSVSFSSDGTMLASGSADRTVILWNVASRKQIGLPIRGNVGDIQALGFSPDSRMLALAGFGGTVIWDMRTAPPRPLTESLRNASARFAFSPDSATIALSSESSITLFDIVSQKPVKTLEAPSGGVQSIAFSRDGGSVAAGFSDNAVAVYDTGNNQITEPKKLAGHRAAVESVAFSPVGAGFASGSRDGDLILWNLTAAPRISRTLGGVKEGAASLVSFSPDRKLLASGNLDGTISLWNAATTKSVGDIDACHTKEVTSLAFSPDGTLLASGCEDQTVVLLDVGGRRRLAQLKGHRASVSYVAFSRDGRSLISASQEPDAEHHMVLFWDVASRTRRRDFTLPGKRMPALAPDGGQLASVEGNEKILLRAIASNAGVGQPRELRKNNHQMGRLVFSPDGNILASYAVFTSKLKSEFWLSHRPAILLWHTDGSQAPGALRDYEFSDVMSFGPQAKLLAVAAKEGTSLWDLATHQQIGALMDGRATNLAFSPDSLILAAIQLPPKEIRDKGIRDPGIALWDVGTSELLGWLPAGEVSSFSFSPDGNTLLTSSRRESRTFTLWDLNVNSWKARACAMSNRNFTRDEWEHQFGRKMAYGTVCPSAPESVAVDTIEARSKAAVYEAENLLQSRRITEANAAFMKVLKFRPASAIESFKWNNLCWLGALDGQAVQVMKACEYAVALSPEEVGNVDTRGVARALAGDRKGAIADFQEFIKKWADNSPEGERIKGQRREWIEALNQGKNPFTSDVLMDLRKQ